MNEKQLEEVRNARKDRVFRQRNKKRDNPHEKTKTDMGSKEYSELLSLLVRVK